MSIITAHIDKNFKNCYQRRFYSTIFFLLSQSIFHINVEEFSKAFIYWFWYFVIFWKNYPSQILLTQMQTLSKALPSRVPKQNWMTLFISHSYLWLVYDSWFMVIVPHLTRKGPYKFHFRQADQVRYLIGSNTGAAMRACEYLLSTVLNLLMLYTYWRYCHGIMHNTSLWETN